MILDALVLAGDRKDYKPVGKDNKALAEIMGRPLVDYVIGALAGANRIGRIYVIGPLGELSWLGNKYPGIVLLEQHTTVAENVLLSYNRMCKDKRRHIFVTTSDIPLLQSSEVDSFIEQSGFEDHDIVFGAAGEESLRRFYPQQGKPGIRHACCYFRQGPLRLNNLFIIRYPPKTLVEYSSILYRLRYQKRLMNFSRFILEVIKRNPSGLRLLITLLAMQATLQAERFGLFRAARWIGRFLDTEKAARTASGASGASIRAFVMNYGGAAIDIDKTESLEAVRSRFHEFVSIARDIPGDQHT